METARFLWIDLCNQSPRRGLLQSLPIRRGAEIVDQVERIVGVAHQIHPQFACIEFDYPDKARLTAVPLLKREYPTLPLLMLTEYHSEALAIWAFRSGVWDYRVKPVSASVLVRSIELLTKCAQFGYQGKLCGQRLPEDLIEPAGHLQMPPTRAQKTGMAVAYIAGHYADNLRRCGLAGICHLSPSEFSRAFRQEQGITFEHFLLQYRITQARDLLAQSHVAISQVAYAVGFNDSAYFTRVFRRLVGVTASTYQQQLRSRMALSGASALGPRITSF